MTMFRASTVAGMTGCLAAAVGGLLAAGRLPDPVASHWGLSGDPDGSMPRVAALLVLPALGCVLLLFTGRSPQRLASSLTAFLATLVVLAQLQLVAANYDAADWTQAGSLHPAVLAVLLGLPCLAAVVARHLVADDPATESAAASLGLRATQQAVWFGTAGRLVRVGMRVARDGVHVGLGPLRWRYPLEDIVRAEAARFDAPAWGYRGSRRIFGSAAIVVRRGEAVRLDFHDGTSLTVTVDGAATGAALLNDLLARR